MTTEEIIKLEKYLFKRLSQLYSDNIFTVNYTMREVLTSNHRLSFAIYGKYNNYITIRPSLTLFSDQIKTEVHKIFEIDDKVCYHSLFNKQLITQNCENIFASYTDGFIFNKISSEKDIDKMIFNIDAFMEGGGLEFIKNTNSLEGIESFLNKPISQFTLLEIRDPLIQRKLRKFYKDPRIIRSGIIARYSIKQHAGKKLINQYLALFEEVKVISDMCKQIIAFYDQRRSKSKTQPTV